MVVSLTPVLRLYSNSNIIPYLKKFGTNPATGEKLNAKTLTKLNFFKNANGTDKGSMLLLQIYVIATQKWTSHSQDDFVFVRAQLVR